MKAMDLKSHVSKKQHVPQVNHAGQHRQVPTAPGMRNPNDRTPIGEHNGVHADLGVAPKPKAHGPAPAHGGMFSRTRDGQHIEGMTQTSLANAPDASGKSPLDPTIPGKRLSTPKITPGMRSRSSPLDDDKHFALGQAILAQAKKN
jgi:hypothetical protein